MSVSRHRCFLALEKKKRTIVRILEELLKEPNNYNIGKILKTKILSKVSLNSNIPLGS